MSLSTASPFHKPLPFAFPREPASPPDTLADSYPSAMSLPHPIPEPRNEGHTLFTHVETPSYSRHSRPSVSYQNTGFREVPNRSVHRNYRFFVVVIPPLQIIEEHGQLGNTLASGPSHRLSQGIIMPLFPTMYGQLAAIAKEFNFPSTAGLCLYLHFNESGVVMTPRISEESWHMLWSHLFELPSNHRGLPIGGKIEFDIDLRQARWYTSWLSTLMRDNIEHPSSRIASDVRLDSRASVNEDASEFDNFEAPYLSPPRSSSNNLRHVPKKLSLLNRFDFPASRSESKSGAIQGLDLPEQPSVSKVLSPIAQEEEPRSAKDQLDSRVKSWRASAVVKPTSLTGRGQISLDPVNLPNNVSLDEEASSNTGELNLEDFAWSISSVGPEDYDIMSIGVPSERLPSPDMARRMYDDCPPTPSTATTWGAPLSYPTSPLSDYRAPSLDIGFRNTFSAPLTPATATSWGPPSPMMSMEEWYQEVRRPVSIHLGDRGEFSRPVTPSTATTWGAPLSYPPTPVTPYHVHTPDAAQRSFDYADENGIGPLRAHSQLVEGRPWKLVWPYFRAPQVNGEPVKRTVQDSKYPYFSIYPPVYPHFDLYPAAAVSHLQKSHDIPPVKDAQYPTIQIYAPVYPYNLDSIYPEVQKDDKPAPIFVTTSQYPVLDLYPATAAMMPQKANIVPSPYSNYSYPVFNIYPAVYPHFDLYPAVQRSTPSTSHCETNGCHLKQHSAAVGSRGLSYGIYPNLVIYPATYPHFELYPGKAAEVLEKKIVIKPKEMKIALSLYYPNIDLYPAVYPNFDIYPVSCAKTEKPLQKPSVVVSLSQYPVFDLYPAVYPHFGIYPPMAGELATRVSENISQRSTLVVQSDSYPVIRPYPPVYPHFDLYPTATPEMIVYKAASERPVLLPGATGYPTFSLYPPVYPHLSPYPPIAGAIQEHLTQSAPRYPFLQIYAPVYPHLSIYPPVAASQIMRHPLKSRAMDGNIFATPVARPKLASVQTQKTHHDLHQEIFRDGLIPTFSGANVQPELGLRLPNVVPRPGQRRITATRSPTGPAFHRPDAPPAIPRQLPMPPTTDGVPRSPNALEQIAGYRDTSPSRKYSPMMYSSSRTGVTASQRASMVSPLRQMPLPLPRSAELTKHPNDILAIPGTISSGLNRTRSAGSSGITSNIKTRVRGSYIPQRTHGL
ncbi:hypothetical protein P691DRAFT_695766 [Macrolepiota fuliginosa MF-IS2]|uniref:Uncharacterized protein n=1 Tax=Macrolepiota fuliginosa MF-IS2 TaxID=1400762 RepID=A0A9P6C5M6_9AGAR|nr:hypothetical protein P691DRAFT_695766 [Macrolepiota fuliginosa MF-IS2]